MTRIGRMDQDKYFGVWVIDSLAQETNSGVLTMSSTEEEGQNLNRINRANLIIRARIRTVFADLIS